MHEPFPPDIEFQDLRWWRASFVFYGNEEWSRDTSFKATDGLQPRT